MTDAKNFKCYRRLINRKLLKVSGLCGTPFFSYLPQIYRAQYGDAMLVPLWGAPTRRPEINENIWTHFCYESDYSSLVSLYAYT